MEHTHLIIRADASRVIGLGHVMRCLSIAQEWLRHSGSVQFICNELPTRLAGRLKEERCTVTTLACRPGDEEDIGAVLHASQEQSAKAVVVDGYAFSDEYEAALADCRLLAFDDHRHATHRHAEFILNQNFGAEALEYEYATDAPRARLLLGSKYALLRREFLDLPRPPLEETGPATRVLVTLGGSDPHNITRKVVRGIQQTDLSCNVRLVLGAAYHDPEELREFVGNDERFELHQDVRNMAEMYAWAHVAICGGGSANWELCYYGLPRLLIVLAENQIPIADALARHQCAINLGWHEAVSSSEITSGLIRLMHDPAERIRMCQSSRRVVDGRGAQRVVGAILLRTRQPA